MKGSETIYQLCSNTVQAAHQQSVAAGVCTGVDATSCNTMFGCNQSTNH